MTASFVFHIVLDFFHGTFCEIFLYVRRMPEKFPYDPRMADKRPLRGSDFLLSPWKSILSQFLRFIFRLLRSFLRIQG